MSTNIEINYQNNEIIMINKEFEIELNNVKIIIQSN